MLPVYSVRKSVLEAYFTAFKTVPDAPRTMFVRHGLATMGPDGEFEIVDAAPLDKVTLATNELIAFVGPQKAFDIGLNVVNHAELPPGAVDIVSALRIFDAGYHLNHLKDGVPMFDPQTGTMLDGIGHYAFVSASKHRAVMEVDCPYHCDLDRGILQGWARRFDKSALVTHIEPSVCRKNRHRSCRIEVSWK